MSAHWLNEWRRFPGLLKLVDGVQFDLSLIRLDLYRSASHSEVSLVLFGFGVQVTW